MEASETLRVANIEEQLQTAIALLRKKEILREKATLRRDAKRAKETAERQSRLKKELLAEDSVAGELARRAEANGLSVTVDYERRAPSWLKPMLKG